MAKTMNMPSPAAAHGVLQLRITLLDVAPDIWRSVQLPGDINLLGLHDVVQELMGWNDAHPHEFLAGHLRFAQVPGQPRSQTLAEAAAEIGELLPAVGARIDYVYDAEDRWEHVIVVESLHPLDATLRYPRCVGGARACPPEDCGGARGYAELLRALGSPDHTVHQACHVWLGENYDPEFFDLDAVNAGLGAVQLRRRADTPAED